jgi:hypothetical protein
MSRRRADLFYENNVLFCKLTTKQTALLFYMVVGEVSGLCCRSGPGRLDSVRGPPFRQLFKYKG